MNDRVYNKALSEVRQLADEAGRRGIDANSAALATASIDGRPSVRTISIARVAVSGVTFFADSESGKGRQLQANPRAALCFHWEAVHHQVIFEGSVEVLDDAESAKLWRSVPREYALGHWASPPGDTPGLRQSLSDYKKQFEDDRVPLPPNWRAYELKPERIAIWATGWQKLRQRKEYVSRPQGWVESHANP